MSADRDGAASAEPGISIARLVVAAGASEAIIAPIEFTDAIGHRLGNDMGHYSAGAWGWQALKDLLQ